MKFHANTKSKKLLLVLGAIFTVAVIIATTVFSTVAYLTATASVTNTFTVGKVMLTLNEAAVGTDGKMISLGERVQSNNYHLVPNKTYDKDPVITIDASSEASYMFVIVRNDLEGIECENIAHTNDHTNTSMTAATSTGAVHNACIAHQLEANGWKYVETRTAGKVYVYVGSGTTPLPVRGDQVNLNNNRYVLFRTFTVAENAVISDSFIEARVTINAFAIQADTMADADAAWGALCQTYSSVVGTVVTDSNTGSGN